MGLWSFLRGIWPWRPRPRPGKPPTAPPAAAEGDDRVPEDPGSEALAPAEVPSSSFEPAESLHPAEEEPQDEDDGWDDEDDDPDGPDPFISAPPPAPEPSGADLDRRRADARATALAGEHRIFLSMPAGPGSLAEALNQLSAEGLIEAEFVEDGEGEPHILYRPRP